MGSAMVRSPFWNYLAIHCPIDDTDPILEPIEPPNDFVVASVGKWFFYFTPLLRLFSQ